MKKIIDEIIKSRYSKTNKKDKKGKIFFYYNNLNYTEYMDNEEVLGAMDNSLIELFMENTFEKVLKIFQENQYYLSEESISELKEVYHEIQTKHKTK